MRRPLALRASPERSFEAFYRRHAPDVYRYALALLASPADAEEVTQTTFLNAHRAIERGEHPHHPRAWLRAIALNLCRQRFRQAARRPSEVPLLDDDVAVVVPDDDAPTLDDLTRALKHLPFNQRAALVMREFEGRSPAEIAEALELSPAAVETLLFRARRALREQLEGSLTCQEAERAVSQQLDGLLVRAERGPLRAHLRECAECASLARSMRAQSGSMKSLALLPVPSSLAWASGAGSAGAGAGIAGGGSILGSLAAKMVAGTIAATALAGTTYEGVTHAPWRASKPAPSARMSAVPATSQPARADSTGSTAGASAVAIDVVARRVGSGSSGSKLAAPATLAALGAPSTPVAKASGPRGTPAGPGLARGRPGSASPGARRRPGSATPAAVRRPGSGGPTTVVRRPGSAPGAVRRPGSARPATATRKPATRPGRAGAPTGRSSGSAAKPATRARPKTAPAKTREPGSAKPVAPAASTPAARTPPVTEPPSAPSQQAPATRPPRVAP